MYVLLSLLLVLTFLTCISLINVYHALTRRFSECTTQKGSALRQLMCLLSVWAERTVKQKSQFLLPYLVV